MASLAGQQSPRMHFSTPKCWGYRHTAFSHGCRVFVLAQASALTQLPLVLFIGISVVYFYIEADYTFATSVFLSVHCLVEKSQVTRFLHIAFVTFFRIQICHDHK